MSGNFGTAFGLATLINFTLVAAEVIYGLWRISLRCSPTPGIISAMGLDC